MDAFAACGNLGRHRVGSVRLAPPTAGGSIRHGSSYDALAALDKSKPMMIAETASTEDGGDKAAWIRSGFLTAIPSRFKRIKAVVWFHEHKETSWSVDSSSASLSAFREVVASSLYQGRLP